MFGRIAKFERIGKQAKKECPELVTNE